ncbi:helicase-related protein [Nocardia sp. NPDC019219]|uniref:helicase-related protein n=1 Tax=Nocardia sp. NPDC019219 TaxID=3154590 RepID=UPI0033FBF9BE
MTAISHPVITARSLTSEEQDQLLGSLVERIEAQATGSRYRPGKRLSREEDRGRLWLGMLGSEPVMRRDVEAGIDTVSRTLPAAQGFSFRTTTGEVTLKITLECAFYLALHPTYDEQVEPLLDSESGRLTLEPGSGTSRSIASRWTKVAVEPFTLPITIDTREAGVTRFHEDEITRRLAHARALPSNAEPYRPLRKGGNPAARLPRDADLMDELSWNRYCANNLVGPEMIVLPEHRAVIHVDVSPQSNGLSEVLVTVVNRTPAPKDQNITGSQPYEDRRLDPNLYEVILTAETTAEVRPYELEQVGGSHRYERRVRALGHACSVTTHDPDSGNTRLRTEFIARQTTHRVRPRQTVDTSFESFISDPVATTEALVSDFSAWVDRAWSAENLDALADERGWDKLSRRDADEDAQRARREVEWVRAGMELLRSDPAVQDAFIAANKTMRDAGASRGDNPITSWYPFQVAWIIGCLPGMADPRSNDDVNIVWFSTGGGKSEAYLGLMLVTLFYGRYTGTTAGAQVWARFPLRLLALQQTERFASMVLHAELLRRTDPRIRAGDPFGVGFFAGGGNTPNKLYAAGSRFYRGADPHAGATAEMCRVLVNCPICAQDVDVEFDHDAWTMRHVCRNAGCPMQGTLPVWGVDDDIYRHAPAVLVGTVDRLAALGFSKEFQVLLGRAHSRCPRHGYRADPNWCPVYGCEERSQPVARGFGHVRLEIADELHLLEEGLGALDGMYETLLQRISERLGNQPIQIVGATATIEGYQTQVRHLYQRNARRFPENGPDVGETFWARTDEDEPMRQYVGVRPRVGTMVTAATEVIAEHRNWVKDLINSPESVVRAAGLDPADSTLVEAARAAGRGEYEVMLAYCLRNEDLNTVIREEKVVGGIDRQINLAVINGDTDIRKIKDTVKLLQRPNGTERVKLVAATKAIGHGFDVARLGVMTVVGTPTQAAEVIQASARVGRRAPGLVVTVANPQRDRDSSVFRYYPEWIRYLDRMVHNVPVNRESLQVLQRLLSGGLMAWLLQVHDRQWITGGRRRKSLADSTAFAEAVRIGYLNRDTLVSDLSDGFGIDPSSEFHRMHRDAIAAWVDDQLTSLPMRGHANTRLPDLLYPPVPRSLRDVEEPVIIHGEL